MEHRPRWGSRSLSLYVLNDSGGKEVLDLTKKDHQAVFGGNIQSYPLRTYTVSHAVLWEEEQVANPLAASDANRALQGLRR